MKMGKILAVLVMAITLTSCVSKKQFDAMKINYDQCITNIGERQREIQDLKATNAGLSSENSLLKDQNNALKSSLDACLANQGKGSANIDKLIGEINSSNKYIKQLISTNAKNDSLNLALSNRLKRSLDNVADQDVQVKVLKGVVMISLSDKMLYKTGDYNVLPQAQEVLGKVAKVINDYDTYSVLIEGNTDNVPLNSSSLPKDNWDLSALRATSMAKILQTQFGVNPNRITAGGRSEYNPKTTNASVSGRAENRRTEIIIMPKLDEFMKLMDIAPVKN
ncbi:MAG TPA: OmpA family protein [Kaistella sp.]|jgi:Flagellar motor protein|uniref:OmpA family protein n=1 Tax=Candidatus Kaistella beijingensis TaxID=2820270 RepID=UPI001AC29F2E|nr:OmpA family protein [Candidatus Kaistella beijingensis]MBN8622522.1 OmpA family protein [Flavobacteriales bacterium]MCA0391414.1 OmpA family protein [Bacteroidota bacterium]HMU06858.1 OmpA family protein [Kaistella sp.]UBB89277.1 OmpA family protein [Candidatus Kaistella beijingensis]HOB23262.1 OmpA family protein [Kaistella sp.]